MTKVYCSFIVFLFGIIHVSASDNNINIKAEVLNEYTTRIPFKLIGHLIVVEGNILNQKGNFIIDTGSEKLILNKVHFPFRSGKNSIASASGVLGTIESPIRKRVDSLTLQKLIIQKTNADIINLYHIEKSKNFKLLGIIGYNILKDFEVFIDLHLNQITLTKVDKYGNRLDSRKFLERIVDSVEFKLRKHTIVLNATIGSKKLKLGLDSGAEFNQISKSVNKRVLQSFTSFRRIFVIGASNRKSEVLVGKLNNLKLKDSLSLMPMNTVLINFTGMYDAYGAFLDGVLGYEFLRQKRTIINYRKEKLYFLAYPN